MKGNFFDALLKRLGVMEQAPVIEKEDWPIRTQYELELVEFDHGFPPKTNTTPSVSVALSWTHFPHIENFFLLIGTTKLRGTEKWAGDECQIWFNAQRAYMRIQEHCSHYATDPNLPADDTKVWFCDDRDGDYISLFPVPFEQTVSHAQAFEALRFWIAEQEKPAFLNWN